MPSDAHLRTKNVKFLYTTTIDNNKVNLEFLFFDCENKLIYKIDQSEFSTALAEIV